MQHYFAPLIAAVLCGLSVWLLLSKSSRRVAAAVSLLTIFMVGTVVFVWQSGKRPADTPDAPPTASTQPARTRAGLAQLESRRPIQVVADGYVSSSVCRECHPDNHATWSASYHRTMTQVASPAAVLGDFDDLRVAAEGRTYHLRKRNDVCSVEMDNPDAPVGRTPRVEVPIVMTTGSHHMQVYWYATGHGRLIGQLPLVYLRESDRWIPRDAAFLVPPDVSFSSETGRWNETCIGCHTTHGRPRPNVAGQWDTQVAEFGISCEACHGPGGQHVAARRGTRQLAGPPPPQPTDDAIVNPARLSHRKASQVCGHCHSVSTSLNPRDFSNVLASGYQFRPGQELTRTRVIVRDNEAGRKHLAQYIGDDDRGDGDPGNGDPAGGVDEYLRDRFWADGMIRISGREYNGLIESACFQQGSLSCLSCHVMHKAADDPRGIEQWANDQLRPDMAGDTACLKCHAANRFGSAHTHHASDSAGSRCYNCHMPHTTYGLLKAIRSHQISSPNVGRDLRARRPNACNLCHLDQTLDWSARHLHQWYGTARPSLDGDQKSVAASLLWLLRGDAGQRALAAWSMGWKPAQAASGKEWQAPFLGSVLEDPYDAVRFIAYRSLRTLPGFEAFDYDFVGPDADRSVARTRAWRTWRARSSTETGVRLLIDDQKQLRLEELSRLLRQRDERRVNLVE